MSESAAVPSLPGQSIAGRYWLEAQLGVDRFGVSYRAKHAESQRTVALKLLRSSFTDRSDRTERAEPIVRAGFERGQPIARSAFERDLSAIIALEHPNIAAVIDHGQVDEQPFIVSEWLEGETLAARLLRGQLTAAEAMAIVRQLLAALSAAHAMRLIHGDLAPDKVFLQRRKHGPERVKLLDLGLGSLRRPETPPAADGVERIATYLAPEQRGGAAADARSDVYALGKILAAMVARPVSGGRSDEVAGGAALPAANSGRVGGSDATLAADSGRLSGNDHVVSDEPTARRRRDSGPQRREPAEAAPSPARRARESADTASLREVIRRATSAEPSQRFADAAHMLCELIDELAREAGSGSDALGSAAAPAASSIARAPTLQPMAAGPNLAARSGGRAVGTPAPLPIPLPATAAPRSRAFLVVESLLAVSLLVAGAGSVLRMLAARNERNQASHSAAVRVSVPAHTREETKLNAALAAPSVVGSDTSARGTGIAPAAAVVSPPSTTTATATTPSAATTGTATPSAATTGTATPRSAASGALTSSTSTGAPTPSAASSGVATTTERSTSAAPPTTFSALSNARTPVGAASANAATANAAPSSATSIASKTSPTPSAQPASSPALSARDSAPSPRPKAGTRDPWQDPVPTQLNGLLVQATSGGEGGEWTIRHLQEFNQTHPDDTRGHLLLARFYLNRLWRSDAVAQYALALQRDPSVRGTPDLLPILLDIVAQGRAAAPAQALIEKYWGRDALPEVDTALGRVTNPDAARRVHDLSARLIGK